MIDDVGDGVGVAAEFGCLYPEACSGLILAHPVGGHRWMVRTNTFFNRHTADVRVETARVAQLRAQREARVTELTGQATADAARS